MTSGKTLENLGERRLISEVLGKRYTSLPNFGDDCAVIPLSGDGDVEVVATTDPCPSPLVAALGWNDLYYTGWLLATINLSDLAAAGAKPVGLMTTYVLPGDLPVEDFESLVDGVDSCCKEHGTQVVGGNLDDGPQVELTGTAIGLCQTGERLSRRGARAGDVLMLIGEPGFLWATALLCKGHAALSESDTQAVFDRALRPHAEIRAGRALAAQGFVRSAMDVSDGLYPSVVSLCDTNGLGAVLDPSIALHPLVEEVCRQAAVDPFELAQLWGDWTLLTAVEPAHVDEVIEVAAVAESSARPIGVMTESRDLVVDRPGAPALWRGIDSERFSSRSWHADQVTRYIERLCGTAK